MAHQRLRQQETVPENVKRIMLEQLDRAIDRLTSKSGSKDRAIHDSRVSFKKVRSMLRLVRHEIGEQTFKEENILYRDAGRELAGLRDTVVVADTLKKLVEDFSEHYAATDLKWLRKQLMSSRLDRRIDRKEVLQRVAKTVEASRERVKDLPLNVDSFLAIAPGLRNVYRKGRKSFKAAGLEPLAENLHELRKQAKHLWYQIGVLNPIWPKVLEAHALELHRLSEFLSEDHDLALLKKAVFEQASLLAQIEDGENLVALIAVRQEQLQKKAMALAARLYAEKPKALVARFQTYWKESRPDRPSNAADGPRSQVVSSSQAGQPEETSWPSDSKASAASEQGS